MTTRNHLQFHNATHIGLSVGPDSITSRTALAGDQLRSATFFELSAAATRTRVVPSHLWTSPLDRADRAVEDFGVELFQRGSYFGSFLLVALFFVELFQPLIKDVPLFNSVDSQAFLENLLRTGQVALRRRSKKIIVRPTDPTPAPRRILLEPSSKGPPGWVDESLDHWLMSRRDK